MSTSVRRFEMAVLDVGNDSLLYRRQYILGPEYVVAPGWRRVKVAEDLFLTAHPALEVLQVASDNVRLTLIGFVIDPYHPEFSNEDILSRISEKAVTFEDVVEETFSLSGRWAIVCDDGSAARIFTDAAGMRQVFYLEVDGRTWCASQPALASELFDLSLDSSVINFIGSSLFERNEGFWPGDGTPFKEIKHLPPNHYFNFKTGKRRRFWPVERIADGISLDEAVKTSAEILSGSFKGAAHRYSPMLAVTAGWDSRVLLAASRGVKDDILYYVMKDGSGDREHMDVAVPSALLPKLGLELNILDISGEVTQEFDRAFHRNTTGARGKIERGIYAYYAQYENRLRVSGMVGEVGRDFYKSWFNAWRLDGELLTELAGYAGSRSAKLNFTRWLVETGDLKDRFGVNLLDLFYWEQRMGNWAALGTAEADIASDEFTPFNNRRLLATFLSVPLKYKMMPKYALYRAIIEHLWPKALVEPINPLSTRQFIKKVQKKFDKKIAPIANGNEQIPGEPQSA